MSNRLIYFQDSGLEILYWCFDIFYPTLWIILFRGLPSVSFKYRIGRIMQCKQRRICRELANRINLLWEKDAAQVTKQPMRVERLKIPSHSRPFSPPIIWLASHFFPISAVTWIWAGLRWSVGVGNGMVSRAKPFGEGWGGVGGGWTINQHQQEQRVQGIYKDVLGQPTCGHCDEFASTLPRQTTSLYHGPVVINLPGRPASWGIARPKKLFRPGGTHFISHSICSFTLSFSLCLSHSVYFTKYRLTQLICLFIYLFSHV